LNLTTYLDPEKHNDAASLAQFLSVSHRWLHIELTCPCDTDELDSIGGHIPMLRSLFLQEFENGALLRPLHAFTLAPSLRSVALEQRRMSSWISHHNPDNRSLATLRIPVHQLTSLTLNHGDRWHLLPDLAGVRNLLILINPSLTPSSSTPSIRCESLHTLSISAIGDTSYSKLVLPTPLDSLEAPNLGKLAIINQGAIRLDTVSSFVQRSACYSIHELVLERIIFRAAELLGLLPYLASVTRLALVDLIPHALTDKVMDAFTAHGDVPPPLPNLTHLRIGGAYMFRTQVFHTMLQSRAPGRPEPKVGADILRVDITLCNRHISAEELALFRVLKTDGMNLSFRGQKDSKVVVQMI
jgi:hypothetical protein